MMWERTKRYLVVTSLTLNVAFIGTWIAHTTASHAHPEATSRQGTENVIWCPLHQELGVTGEQWTQIEPRLRAFRVAVEELRQQTNGMRAEVIKLIAAKEPDGDTIRARQDEILATKGRIQDLVAEHLLAEKQDLTPKQQTKLFEMLRNRTSFADGPPLSGRTESGFGASRVKPHENLNEHQ
jgi:Spy/CpxP family protein refolding chaperone